MKLRWMPDAIDDRTAIYDYIDRESPASAIIVDDRILKAIAQLIHFPDTGRPGRRKGTRELIIAKTSLIAVYTIRGSVVLILRLIHTSRRWPRTMPQL